MAFAAELLLPNRYFLSHRQEPYVPLVPERRAHSSVQQTQTNFRIFLSLCPLGERSMLTH